MKSHDPLAPLTDAPPPAVGAKRPSNNLRPLQRKTARGQTWTSRKAIGQSGPRASAARHTVAARHSRGRAAFDGRFPLVVDQSIRSSGFWQGLTAVVRGQIQQRCG